MPAARVMAIGERFGRLVVIERAPNRRQQPSGRTYRVVKVRCDCGTELEIALSNLRSGNSTTCGCSRDGAFQARVTKHGMSETGIYFCWLNMKQRSSGHYTRPAYKGVGRDPRWDSFDNFVADMGATYFDHAVLARYGDTGDYTPTNCRWITKSQNSAEQRRR